MIHIFSYSLSGTSLMLIVLAAVLTGMSKTGIQGAGMLTSPIMAIIFGGHLSSGVALPMLILADILAVWYYHRHAMVSYLGLLFPWAALGIIIGTIAGNFINDEMFRVIMAITIFISIALMLWIKNSNEEAIPRHTFYTILIGVTGGFTSMVGNLAGPVMSVYFLSAGLPKNRFIGTAAWFFLLINVFKVPFHIYSWHTIDLNSLILALCTLPFVILGAVIGIFITKTLSEKSYRWFIIIMTLATAVFMLF